MTLISEKFGYNEDRFYRPHTKFTKVMFLHVSVCPQGGSTWAGTPPGRNPPWDQVSPTGPGTPWAGTPPGEVPPPPGPGTPH